MRVGRKYKRSSCCRLREGSECQGPRSSVFLLSYAMLCHGICLHSPPSMSCGDVQAVHLNCYNFRATSECLSSIALLFHRNPIQIAGSECCMRLWLAPA